jgi:hypothetical protein
VARAEGKRAGGPRFGAAWRGKWGREREGGRCSGGYLGRPTSAPWPAGMGGAVAA